MYNLNSQCMLCTSKATHVSKRKYEKVSDSGFRILCEGYVYSCDAHFESLAGNDLTKIKKEGSINESI